MKKIRFLSILFSMILTFTFIASPLTVPEAMAAPEVMTATDTQTQVSATCGVDGLTDVNGNSTVDSATAAPKFTNGIELRMNTGGSWPNNIYGDSFRTFISGKDGWIMKASGIQYMAVGVSNDFILGDGVNPAPVKVEVTYYNGSGQNGEFKLRYNIPGKTSAEPSYSEAVILDGTTGWETHTFVLTDAAMNNAYDVSRDFRLSLVSGQVFINKVVVRKYIPGDPGEPDTRTQVSATLGPTPAFGGLVMRVKGDGAWNTTVVSGAAISGPSYWSMLPAANSFYLFGNVDDQFIRGGSNYVAVDVTYYDGTSGFFSLNYNSQEAQDIWSDFVLLSGTNQWITHTFLLPNAAFNNGCFGTGMDFRLGVYTSHGMSPAAVNISQVVVRKLVKPSTITAMIKSNHIGNIFYNDEPYDISLDLNSDYLGQKNITVSYKVKNNNNLIVMENSESLQIDNLGTKNIPINFLSMLNSYGVFTMDVELQDDSGNILRSYSFPFSRILSGDDKLDLLGTCTHFGLGRGVAATNLPLVANAGIKFIRDEMLWQSVEQSQGVYTFKPEWENYIDTAISNELEPLIILDYGNPMYENGNGPTTDEAVAAYARYCYEVANHFKGRVKYFEVWNEWNWGTGNNTNKRGDQYGKLIVAASAAIREANPDAYIIGMALGVTDNNYVADVLSYPGAYEAMDAIAAHPYSFPRKPEGEVSANLQGIRDVFTAKGLQPLPVWMTEMGWPSGNPPYGISETMSAAYGVRALAWALANPDIVERFFWYDFQNDGTDKDYYEDNFGLVDHWKNLDVPVAAKASYAALSAFATKLSGYEFIKSIPMEKGIYSYLFKDNNSIKPDILIVWSDGLQKTISLNIGSAEVELTDLFGNSSTPPKVGGGINLFVTDQPVYIAGNFSDDISYGASSFGLPTQCSAFAGGAFTMTVTRDEAVSGLSGEYQLTLPEGWSLNSGSVFEAASELGPTMDDIVLNVPEGTPDGKYPISLKVVVGGNEVLSAIISVTVTTPKVYEISPYLPNPEDMTKWAIAVTIHNYSIENKKGTITLVEPANWVNTKEYDISRNSSQTLILDIPEVPGQLLYLVKLRIEEAGKPSKMIEQKISFLAAIKATNTMMADGVLNDAEWKDAMPFVLNRSEQYKNLSGSWEGIQDLNATGYLKWDEENLYLAVRAEDDSHYQNAIGSDIWKGDGIQFTIDPSRSIAPGFDDYNEIGFALNSEDNLVYNNRWKACIGKSTGQMTDVVFGVKRDNRSTVYEAVIPWSSIAPGEFAASVNKFVGFALVLNDNDSGTRKGYFEYMSGIGAGKDFNMFGDLLLVER